MKRVFHVLFALVVGCGAAESTASSGRGAVTTSAAAAPGAAAPSPAVDSPAEAPEQSEPPPAGKLVCRAVDAVDGTNELYLVWDGKEATGVIRNTTQSGIRHEQRVKAERADGIIVVDDPHESDLVMHAAVLQQQGGSLMMRLGGSTSGKWLPCKP